MRKKTSVGEHDILLAQNNIRDRIKKINHLYFQLLAHEISGWDLTVPQVLVLRCFKGERLKITSISEKVMLSNSTVSGIIDRLEKNGYVQRVRDQDDRRIVWVEQTEKMRKLKEDTPVLQEEYFSFLLEGLSVEQSRQIADSLELLADHYEQQITKYISN